MNLSISKRSSWNFGITSDCPNKAIPRDLQQPLQPVAADACDKTELGQMGPECIGQRGALADDQMAGPVSHRD